MSIQINLPNKALGRGSWTFSALRVLLDAPMATSMQSLPAQPLGPSCGLSCRKKPRQNSRISAMISLLHLSSETCVVPWGYQTRRFPAVNFVSDNYLSSLLASCCLPRARLCLRQTESLSVPSLWLHFSLPFPSSLRLGSH